MDTAKAAHHEVALLTLIACSTEDGGVRPPRAARDHQWPANTERPDRAALRGRRLRRQTPGLLPERARCLARRRLYSWWAGFEGMVAPMRDRPEITLLADDQP